MGIVHFASVGRSPGAVTSALSYLEHHADEVRGSYEGDVVETVVLFCSHQVNDGDLPSDEYIWNDYGRPNHRQDWRLPARAQNVIEVVRDFLVREQYLAAPGYLYAWPVDVNDYASCFEAIAKATLALARADDTGKYVWANLTGGTNVLNAALMQVASLSGLIGRMYYTFVSREQNRRYLQPFSDRDSEFALIWLPIVKTTFDYGYYRLLELLEDGQWHMGQTLLSLLKQDADPAVQGIFSRMPFDLFKNQYLNRMQEDVFEEQRHIPGEIDRPVRINDGGRRLLEYLHANELTEAIVKRGQAHSDLVQACRQELAEYRC
ncbi:MAG: hypothetical protein JW934_13260 [Anaerolineae bacterium]|nr:hypothetical protein [Anaerolineae bacterium]